MEYQKRNVLDDGVTYLMMVGTKTYYVGYKQNPLRPKLHASTSVLLSVPFC